MSRIQDLLVWEAVNSVGEPVCISDEVDDGYSVNVYTDAGIIVGVLVHYGPDLVGAVGDIPVEVFLDEAQYSVHQGELIPSEFLLSLI